MVLTFILLMCTFGRAPNNASKWEMGFNSVAQRLNEYVDNIHITPVCIYEYSYNNPNGTFYRVIVQSLI
jgi:hypothetical protein